MHNNNHNEMLRLLRFKSSGDTDLDFLAGMIPHHEGAISMSEVIVPHFKDPKLVEFAEGIIKAQKEEIQFMKEWIESNR